MKQLITADQPACDTHSDRHASGCGAVKRRRIHDAAAVLARLSPVERMYAQSTSGRRSSQRIAPAVARSIDGHRSAGTRRLPCAH